MNAISYGLSVIKMANNSVFYVDDWLDGESKFSWNQMLTLKCVLFYYTSCTRAFQILLRHLLFFSCEKKINPYLSLRKGNIRDVSIISEQRSYVFYLEIVEYQSIRTKNSRSAVLPSHCCIHVYQFWDELHCKVMHNVYITFTS